MNYDDPVWRQSIVTVTQEVMNGFIERKLHTPMDERGMWEIHLRMVNVLKRLMAEGHLPTDINTDAVWITAVPETGTVDLQLPYMLQMYISYGTRWLAQRFSSPGGCCQFLGTVELEAVGDYKQGAYSLYHCTQALLSQNTVMAVYGSGPGEYHSGMAVAKFEFEESKSRATPLALAYALAVERGLVEGPPWVQIKRAAA